MFEHDTFDSNGLIIATLPQIITYLEDNMKNIYGNDINIESNTPDGQMINLFAQAARDIRELIQRVNSNFDPDQAEGRVLDQRVAINRIQRVGATFTYQDIDIYVDRALNLVGLDDQGLELNPAVENLYVVKDDEGNEFYLAASQNIIVPATTYSFTFRAAGIGAIQTTPNTITTPVTIVAGIISINNPSSATTVGQDEESDFQLKNRQHVSTAISAIANLDSLEASLRNLTDVVTAKVYENDTLVTDANGVPGKSIWCIVDGGVASEIGQTILSKKTDGCGMKGDEEVLVEKLNGGYFTAKYDVPIPQDLYIQFNISLPFSGVIDTDFLKQQIVDNIIWTVGGDATSDTLYYYLKTINQNYIITGVEVSDDGITWTETISPTTVQYRFANDTTRISITT
jgi:uncharacterized phage protein gp47/JayE